MRRAPCLVALLVTLACGRRETRDLSGWIPAPLLDPTDHCADVGTERACWTASGAVLRARRATPELAGVEPWAWRCAGAGAMRRCELRQARAPAFTCLGERCVQRHPRLPSDGEWSCADTAGVTVCRSLAEPAGVARPVEEPGWSCGPEVDGRRVCVDFSPDFPDGDAWRWRCDLDESGAATRRCVELPRPAPTLGAVCGPTSPCVDGARCADGVCLPPPPEPRCLVDRHCPAGSRCRFGSCLGEAE